MARELPFRYRGYYYDAETYFYYLNSRYYDCETGRFINADSFEYLGANGDFESFNLFAYCSNDPVNKADPSGNSITAFVIFIAACAIVGGTFGGVVSHKNGYRGWKLVGEVVKGASIGLLAAGAMLTVGSVVVGAATTASTTVLGVGITKIFAMGALSIDFVAIIAPLFGIFDVPTVSMEEPAHPLQPNIIPNSPTKLPYQH